MEALSLASLANKNPITIDILTGGIKSVVKTKLASNSNRPFTDEQVDEMFRIALEGDAVQQSGEKITGVEVSEEPK